MYSLILGIHIVVCLLLVVVVLLQSGKAADLAGAFGGMGSQSTFGPRGSASFLSKLTTTLAVLFMVTSLSLWILASNRSEPKTVVEDIQQEQTTPTTQTPAATDTEKAAQTGEQQTTDKPAAATTEQSTSQEKNSSDTQKKESSQEKPPDRTDSKQ